MTFNLSQAQQLLTQKLGPKYEVTTTVDSSKYIFVHYKHKDYDADDERGALLGLGPLVFNKESGEYCLLGSGEWLDGDYVDYYPREDSEEEVWPPSKEEIIAGILRRQNVNHDDLAALEYMLIQEFGDFNCHYTADPAVKDDDHLVMHTDLEIVVERFISFFKEIEFPYRRKSETQLLIWLTKSHNG